AHPASPVLVPPPRRPLCPCTTLSRSTDSAVLFFGYFPTGSIEFTLTGPGGFSYTQTDTVNGNGTYTASALLPTTGIVAGVYTWTAHYSGDANNNAANDQGGPAEQSADRQATRRQRATAKPATVTQPDPGQT